MLGPESSLQDKEGELSPWQSSVQWESLMPVLEGVFSTAFSWTCVLSLRPCLPPIPLGPVCLSQQLLWKGPAVRSLRFKHSRILLFTLRNVETFVAIVVGFH